MMGEADHLPSPLPPLRVHHFLTWMVVVAAIETIWIVLIPADWLQDAGAWAAVLTTSSCVTLGTCLSVFLFGITWCRQGRPFPSEPGHWIAAYVSWVGVFEVIDYFLMEIVFRNSSVDMIKLRMVGLQFPYYLIAFGLSVAAYRRERSRYWRWGWGAICLHGALMLAGCVLYVVVLLYRYLYALLWVKGPFHWSPPFSLGSSFGIWYGLIAYYILVALISLAVAADLRNCQHRHWSHWTAVVALQVKLVLLIAFTHWAIFHYF
jgi:hypothetical protein